MAEPLTARQRAILDYIAQYLRDSGFAPTLQDIADHFELSAIATVHKHLEHLRRKGWITRRFNHPRAIALVLADRCCPTCGRAIDAPLAVADAVGMR
jgi:repressor LexA